MHTLKGRDFLSIEDFSKNEILEIFRLAKNLKTKQKKGIAHPRLSGKALAMIFEKPSHRTRVSFHVGMWQLGGLAIDLAPEDIQLGVRESLLDIGRVLSRYVDGIMARVYEHEKLEALAEGSTVPVINGLSDAYHPCQALSDFFTLLEHRKNLGRLKIVFIGDGNNVCISLIQMALKLGIKFEAATPKGYEPKIDTAAKGIKISNDPLKAAKDADVIYTDVWTSMGQEAEIQTRKNKFAAFQVNENMLKLAKKDVLVMHCLPAHRGEEITDEVMDGPHSIVFEQAENRLHVQKAVLALLLG